MSITHWLLTNIYWLAAQGVIQNTSGALMLWGGLMMWHHSCDRHLWCWRPGKFPVKGTSWKVCSNHHTYEHHADMQHRHKSKHKERGL